MKSKSLILRISETEKKCLERKSALLNISVSNLLRQGAHSYFPIANKIDADKILSAYQEGDDEDKQELVDIVFHYYRLTGYPHNVLSDKKLISTMQSLSKTKPVLIEDNHLQVNTCGIALANHFHPHMVAVKCKSGKRTAHELYHNDELFKDAIKRWMDLDKKPNPHGIRRILRTRDGVGNVVNFKPAIAQYFYKNYCPDGGKVLDHCAGYGGRLAAAISCDKKIHYHGIDPDSDTASGNMKMAAFFKKQRDLGGRLWDFTFSFDLGCAEDVMPALPEKSYDLALTSPPYFSQEEYSNEPDQSYIRYPNYVDWRDKFLTVIVRESRRLLKDGGYLILNVKNYKDRAIADDVSLIAEQCGFSLFKTYQQRLSNSEYHRSDGNTWHTEPVFVFRSFFRDKETPISLGEELFPH